MWPSIPIQYGTGDWQSEVRTRDPSSDSVMGDSRSADLRRRRRRLVRYASAGWRSVATRRRRRNLVRYASADWRSADARFWLYTLVRYASADWRSAGSASTVLREAIGAAAFGTALVGWRSAGIVRRSSTLIQYGTGDWRSAVRTRDPSSDSVMGDSRSADRPATRTSLVRYASADWRWRALVDVGRDVAV